MPSLGECDLEVAQRVVYTDDDLGLPAYEGQALIQRSCGDGSYCHAPAATSDARYGTPHGMDFDIQVVRGPDDLTRLADNIDSVRALSKSILNQINDGAMPPGKVGVDIASTGTIYRQLPAELDKEANNTIRNWLACGAPVVERTANDRPAGQEPVGDIVPAVPGGGISCDPTEIACDALCFDPLTSVSHCGTCGDACEIGQACVDGVCACDLGLAACGEVCVDLDTDPNHCGACDQACGPTEACSAGQCVTGGCPAATVNCTGSCVDTDSSVFHCGACSQTCAAGEACTGGVCDCGDTTSDPLNCGQCGNMCPGGTSCIDSSCVCADTLSLCDGTCVDTNVDVDHCGGCGQSCGNGESCDGGMCVTCGSGVSYASDVQPIFNASCNDSRCHDSNNPAGDLDLTPGTSYDAMVGVEASCGGRVQVIAGDPEQSYLVSKIHGINMCSGSKMPKGVATVSPAEIALIEAWICGGALDN